MSDPEPELVVERRGNVALLRINRPDSRNAVTFEVMESIGSTLSDLERDGSVRAVVLTGTGERAFCAGMDLKSLAGGGERRRNDEGMAAYMRLLDGGVAVPVIGAANGSAYGGGVELLLGCDLVVASSSAVFALPEVKRGLIPGGNGTQLTTRVPMAVALELLLTGDPVSASRAYELGLVNSVVDPGDVLDAALDLAGRIAANGPLAVRAVKELGRLAVSDAATRLVRLGELNRAISSSADAREGAVAFVEKRDPVWQGR